MDELKMHESEALDIIESLLDVADMKCTGPLYADDPPRSGMCRIPEEDAAKLRRYIADRRAAPESWAADTLEKLIPEIEDSMTLVECQRVVLHEAVDVLRRAAPETSF